MLRLRSLRRLAPLALAVLLLVAGCGGADEGATETTLAPTSTIEGTTTSSTDAAETVSGLVTEVVSHETTQDIYVTAPGGPESDGWGTWPVVFLLHGSGGDGGGLALTAAELAERGVVVFSATYRFAEPQHIEMDAECSYRYGWTIAEDFGGDLTQPVTVVGHSRGAQVGMYGMLNDTVYGPGGTFDACFAGTPRADLVVPIAGCHYEYQGTEFGFDMSPYTNREAELVLIVGTEDDECEAWQSRDATSELQEAGFDARLVELTDGNHANVVFYEIVNDEWVPAPSDPVGDEVIRTVLAAIAEARP